MKIISFDPLRHIKDVVKEDKYLFYEIIRKDNFIVEKVLPKFDNKLYLIAWSSNKYLLEKGTDIKHFGGVIPFYKAKGTTAFKIIKSIGFSICDKDPNKKLFYQLLSQQEHQKILLDMESRVDKIFNFEVI